MRRIGLLGLVIAGCATNAGSGDATDVRASTASLVELVSHERESAWEWASDPELGTPSHVTGRSARLLGQGASGREATFAFLKRFRAEYKMRDPAREFTLTREQHDELGMTHVRLQQVERGIPVHGAEMMAHYDDSGALRVLDANYVPGLDAVDVTPALDATRALARARTELATMVKAEDDALNVGRDTSRTSVTVEALDDVRIATAPELVIHALEGAPTLAYHVVLRTDVPAPHRMDYLIDAHTGAILRAYDDIETVSGSGTGVLGDAKKIQVSQEGGGSYSLSDYSRTPNGILTYTADNRQAPLPGTLLTSSSTSGWDTGGGAGAAVDAHFYAGVVYDYFKGKHGRLGIDGKDGAIISSAHFGVGVVNAFWDGTQMAYGDGDGSQARPLSVSLDVCGHELTHGVTQNTSNLDYVKQSGALNESMSDIFGSIIEHEYKPDVAKNWLLGEDIFSDNTPFRDFIHPAKFQQPASMKKFVNTTQDNGGVHINSGIPNNAFYLMTMGGTNDETAVSVPRGIGWEKAAKLWYRTETNYLTKTSNFAAAAAGNLSAAKDLQFSPDETNIVQCAWIAVGVVTSPASCQPLTGAANPNGPGGSDAGVGGKDGGKTVNENNGDENSDLLGKGRGCSIGPRDAGASYGAVMLGALGLGMLVARRRTAKKG